ncbi:hypothetical protein [Agrobacterium sp. NPDC090273]|uniref:hypothetical protein n=1 Tax=Agrobacterium sp. NPDC090273 TaxID=3363919 RepID=UPI00383B23F3
MRAADKPHSRQSSLLFDRATGGTRGLFQFLDAPHAAGDTIVDLFGGSDLSTIIQGSSRFFLQATEDMGSRGAVKSAEDMAVLMGWWRNNADTIAMAVRIGRKSNERRAKISKASVLTALDKGTTGNAAMDAAIDEAMQTQFNQAFETYLMEGKAPSPDLLGMFETYLKWLTSIYGAMTIQGVPIHAEVSEIFNRAMESASHAEFARQSTGETDPVFDTAEAMGLPETDYEQFLDLRRQAEDEAKAQLLGGAMEPLRRERQKNYSREKAVVRHDIERSINAEGVYRAIEWMTNGRWLDDSHASMPAPLRLDKAILVDRYGADILDALPRGQQTVYAEKGGLDPDDVAGIFGYSSGDELVQAMVQAPSRLDAVAFNVEQIMRHRHGDILLDGSADIRALDAVHNATRGKWLEIELAAIGRIANRSDTLTLKQAQDYAETSITRMPVEDAVASDRFLAVERRAADEAADLGAGLKKARSAKAKTPSEPDGQHMVEKLYDAKRRQLLNHSLYVESRKIAGEIEATETDLQRFSDPTIREKITDAGHDDSDRVDYLSAIDDLLGRYSFRPARSGEPDGRGQLNAYVATMNTAGRGNELAIADSVLSDARPSPYRKGSVRALRDVIDSIRNVEHSAQRANRLIDATHDRDFHETASGVVSAVEKALLTGALAGANAHLDPTVAATTTLRHIDGGDTGVAYNAIKAPVDDAAERLARRRRKATSDLAALYEVYSPEKRCDMARRMLAPGLGSALSKWDRIAIALNCGNTTNRQRLTETGSHDALNDAQIDAILGSLDERDARFVQSIWDYLASFQPEIAAREKRTTGAAPQWVKAEPVIIGGSELSGGFYPLAYRNQPLFPSSSSDQNTDRGMMPPPGDMGISKAVMTGQFARAQTLSGHSHHEKVAKDGPVDLDLFVLHRHVDGLVLDLELGETLSNTRRILHDDRIRSIFDQADKTADLAGLQNWLGDVAAAEISLADLLGHTASVARENLTVTRLVTALATVLSQATGLSQFMSLVGKNDFAIGVRDALRPDVLDDIARKSAVMAGRQDARGKHLGNAATAWSEIAFWLVQTLHHRMVEVPCWLARYHQGLRSFANDDAMAVAHADDLIKRFRISGNADLSDVERLVSALGSYLNARILFNDSGAISAHRDIPIQQSKHAGVSLAIDLSMLFFANAVILEAIEGTEHHFATSTLPAIRDRANPVEVHEANMLAEVVHTSFAGDNIDRFDVAAIVHASGLGTDWSADQIHRSIEDFFRQISEQRKLPIEYSMGNSGK